MPNHSPSFSPRKKLLLFLFVSHSRVLQVMGLSIVSLIDSFLRRTFLAAGLRPHTIPIDSQTTLHCWLSQSLYPSKPNPNSKPILLLIHGFGPLATWQWRYQVRFLSRHFDLVVPDLLFFGGSTTKSSARSEAFQAESIAQLMDTIIESGRRFDVVGTSYGGFVAYHVARACGIGRVGRAVIASSDLLKGEGDDHALKERAGVEKVSDLMVPRRTPELRKLIDLALHRAPRFVPEFVLHNFLRSLYSDNLEQKLELIRGLTLGNKEEFQLTPLPQEILIIWGEHDRIFPLEKAFQLQKCLGENARLEIVKNTAHVPQVENPQRFNQVLLDFLLDAPSSSM